MNKLKKGLHIMAQVWRKDKELYLVCVCAVVLYLNSIIY
ncbi:hypothetical protein F543_1990 [Bibersteinia trehalosi USDA-ARS-USMARC-189]|uniref:Uncharacterized protein n=2 Tax=Bibersteinia trehalosi TaxID=47735 RepID=W0R988_BIBTR|nr:hypothetical protein F543_1990 [Bibersteinia trehalosi USDA-ARS-USMARC-189]AHG87351.1 hypothetical protein F544_21230 [Bibersteinia trehalosi USDA-ARS-USMARC-190]